jgi:hypothetical protein
MLVWRTARVISICDRERTKFAGPAAGVKERPSADHARTSADAACHSRRRLTAESYSYVSSCLTRAARCVGIGAARASYWSFKHRPIADRQIRRGGWLLSERIVNNERRSGSDYRKPEITSVSAAVDVENSPIAGLSSA